MLFNERPDFRTVTESEISCGGPYILVAERRHTVSFTHAMISSILLFFTIQLYRDEILF